MDRKEGVTKEGLFSEKEKYFLNSIIQGRPVSSNQVPSNLGLVGLALRKTQNAPLVGAIVEFVIQGYDNNLEHREFILEILYDL